MREVYRSRSYDPADIVKSYVSCNVDGEFKLYAVNALHQTIWEGMIEDEIINSDFKILAEQYRGHAFNAVELPHDPAKNFLFGAWPKKT